MKTLPILLFVLLVSLARAELWNTVLPTDPLPPLRFGIAEPQDWVIGYFGSPTEKLPEGEFLIMGVVAQRNLYVYSLARNGGSDLRWCRQKDFLAIFKKGLGLDDSQIKAAAVDALLKAEQFIASQRQRLKGD